MKRVPLILRASIVLATIAASAPLAWSQVNVLTHHNDNRRTGANLHETDLTVASVKQKFGKLWTLFADGQIVAQPLYVSGLQVDGKGTFNAVIVATMHNTIYAYDADKKPTLPQSQDALIWAQWLGQPQPEKFGFDSWNTNFPEYGIVSTPVIDDARTTMYVVSWHNDNGGQFRLHAIDLTKAPFPGPGFPPIDYREKVKPVPVIKASVPKPGGGQLKLDTTQQKQRAALLLDNGVLYLGFSTNLETGGTLHGWLLAYDAATLKQKAVWNVTPTKINGGIWQAGSGPAADASRQHLRHDRQRQLQRQHRRKELRRQLRQAETRGKHAVRQGLLHAMQPGAAGQSVRWWRTLRSGFGLGGTAARSGSHAGFPAAHRRRQGRQHLRRRYGEHGSLLAAAGR